LEYIVIHTFEIQQFPYVFGGYDIKGEPRHGPITTLARNSAVIAPTNRHASPFDHWP